jgi:hypothetical protein
MQFRRRNNSQSTTRKWVKRLALSKDLVSVVKDGLDILWRIAPLTLLAAGLLLWSYLREIGWPDLFRDSALSASGLLFLVLAAFVLAVTFLAIFLAPSFIMVTTIQELHRKGLVQRDVIRLYAGGVVGWTLGMLCIWQSASLWWTLAVIPLAIVTAMGLVRARTRWRGMDFANRFKTFMQILMFAGCATFSVAFTAFPLPFVIRFVLNNPEEYTLLAQYGFFVLSVIVTVIGLLPGYVYLAALTSSATRTGPVKPTLAAAAFLSFLILFVIWIFAPVSSLLLTGTAVYSNEIASFQVTNTDLFKLMKAGGLKVETKDDMSIVRAYVRYNFGGVELLCTTPYVPKSPGKVPQAGTDPHPAGAGCVRTQSSELRRFRGAVAQPAAQPHPDKNPK